MYGVSGIPHVEFNGVQSSVGGYPNANWQPMYNAFLPIYNSMVGDNSPFEIEINGMVVDDTAHYEVVVSMDADYSSANMKLYTFLVEDDIYSYWGAVGQWHDANNVNRDWRNPVQLTISTAGQSETIADSYPISASWVQENVKIIAIVQNSSTKEIFQVNDVLIDEMNSDIDDDGVSNYEDNCPANYNPGQEDIDGDLAGDACDACDNLNVYVTGNVTGDATDNGPVIDVFDVLYLLDLILQNEYPGCSGEVADFTGDHVVNYLDAVYLVQNILNSGGNLVNGFNDGYGTVAIGHYERESVISLSNHDLITGFQLEIKVEGERHLDSFNAPQGWIIKTQQDGNILRIIGIDLSATNPQQEIQLTIPGNVIGINDIAACCPNGKQILFDQNTGEKIEIPSHVSIGELFPNPFNPTVSIPFTVPYEMPVTVAVFDLNGKLVETLQKNQFMTAGLHTLQWNAALFSSGIYFIRVETKIGSDIKKAFLVK